jgi:Protein of unknown function (DUF4100)
MGDTRGATDTGAGGTDRVPYSMEDILGSLALYMQHHRADRGGQSATKALRAVVTKTGRFDGKNVSKFLRIYVCEMEVHQIDEEHMMHSFDMAVVPDIRERIQEIREIVVSWTDFAERLRDEYFDEDTERVTKRSFLEWVEQRPGKSMGPNELLKDFERKFGQLPLAEKRLLDSRKAELFLQAADDALEDRLLLLLGDRTTEGGFTNDWRRVEETVVLLAKQQRVRSRGIGVKNDPEPILTSKPSKLSFAPSSSTNPSPILKAVKTTEENALEELIKGFRELRVEMSELRRSQASSSSQRSDTAREYVWRCIFCDKTEKESSKHRLRDCAECDEAVKNGFIIFIDGKIHDAATKSALGTNFGKGGMKKLLEEKMTKSNSIHVRGAETYHIEVEQHSIDASLAETTVVLKRGAQAIRNATGWEDPVDVNTIRAFLESEKDIKDHNEVSVEEKRARTEAEDGEEPTAKKRPQVPNNPPKEMRHRVTTRSKATSPDLGHPNFIPLPDKDWGQPGDNKNEREKADSSKAKNKGPAYKLQSDIETSIDMKGILEERILDAKIEFTLREALGIAKKDFHELIIDIIKRKRQMTAEAVMVSALDTHMTEDEEMEIGEVFAMMGNPMTQDEEIVSNESERVENLRVRAKSSNILKVDEVTINEAKMETANEEAKTMEVKIFECTYDHSNFKEGEERSEFHQPFWARATTETRVKLGGLIEPVLALVDHGSEINIISREIYEKGKWPIDTDHGWIMRAANSGRTRLYGACPAVPTKIGDVVVEQNFFVQNSGAYPVLLGQPFITASRMETKVLDDGSHYARIRSIDGKRSLQFLTVRPDNERHRIQLREGPLPTSLNFSDF